MQYNLLPSTNIKVSKICLGTMTWGQQNTEAEGHEQLNYATNERGINFIDTAEMYSVPAKAETQGSTERIIGTWLKKRNKRDDIILASKVAGPSAGLPHIGTGRKFNKENITRALNESLQRLQTDYIDLYQLHWPERPTNYFGTLGYVHASEDAVTDFVETLTILNEFIQLGKIRYIGISNETPWGVMQYLRTAEKYNLPKIVTIQNPYNLVNRVYEIGLAEIGEREKVGLLAYSPLAGGLLSDKYLGGKRPDGARFTLWPNYFGRYAHPNTMKAVEKYAVLAKAYNLSLAQMSLAYVNTRTFLTSNIIGATNMQQLTENIGSIDVTLSEEVMKEIQKIHLEFPNPAP
ncbi:MAG TPA: NADP(H)-dependent aldo-keto reductase [Chitinophagales bacterium]|nr:NADP(H)-dependent aldo-keto reductase [Chitinophagales bacterium]